MAASQQSCSESAIQRLPVLSLLTSALYSVIVVSLTFGGSTRSARFKAGIPDRHSLDAVAMGSLFAIALQSKAELDGEITLLAGGRAPLFEDC